MEYVHGEPLDRYCDRQQLDLRARLQLFLDICSAVQYAHQNLVVHRDLKPANILVTAEGAPKLLDFGIAKLLDAGEAAAVLALTRMNDRLLTPEYASPEQILGRPVTTASDVYALGVVLYELLTGLRPVHRAGLGEPAGARTLDLHHRSAAAERARSNARVESGPARRAVGDLAVAAARGSRRRSCRSRLLGDIDAIVMRALRKEPQHRYSSVEQLASDVRRLPDARAGSCAPGQLAVLLAAIHSPPRVRRVSAGAAFFVFIIAFAMVSTIQAQRIAASATARSRKAAARRRSPSSCWRRLPQPIPYRVRGARRAAAARRQRSCSREPDAEFGRTWTSIRRCVRGCSNTSGAPIGAATTTRHAISYLQDAVELRSKMSEGAGDEATGGVMVELAISMRESGDVLGSDNVLCEASDMLQRLKQERSLTYARMLANRGRVQMRLGKPDAAQTYFDQSLALLQDDCGPARSRKSRHCWWRSRLRSCGRTNLVAAERNAREAVDIYATALPQLHPDRAHAQAQLARSPAAAGPPGRGLRHASRKR